jgi:predicted Zn-dependent peptidase
MNLKPEIVNLKPGPKLVFLNIPQFKSVTALLMVKVGSRYETDKQAGISHFLEHLVSKGTKKYPNSLAISTKLDSIGAEHNAFTSKEYTGYYVKSASAHLNLSLDILSQLVFEPLLKPENIKKEKGVIIEEINMYNDMPMAKVARIYEELLYHKTSLGREVIGFKKSVSNLQSQDFKSYLNFCYQPFNMVLGIIGGFKTKNLKNQVKKYFARSVSQKSVNRPKKLKFMQTKPELKISFKKTQQTHLCLGFRSYPKGHKNRYTLAVLSTILGGNMSSRLFTQVRENRGLAYYIKSNINTYFDNGYLVVQAGVDVKKLEQTIKVILTEFSKLKTKNYDISLKELNRAKDYLKGKLALSLEDSKDIAGLFVEDLLLENKIRTYDQIIKGVEKVGLDDLKKVAKQVFVNKGLNLAVIGPYKTKDKFSKILKL